MKFICCQAGHLGRTTGATGAPGEKEINERVWLRLSQILIDKGFMVQLVNADPTDAEIKKDFDLFLSLHCDADIYGTGGGVIASGDKSVDDSWQESKRIKEAIESEYFKHSEIVNHPERSNVNMTKYYMWSRLTSKTPCVILEMGVAQDAHDKVLLADTERIASAIARGVCKAFGVDYDQEPVDPCAEVVAELEEAKTIISTQETELTKLRTENKGLTDKLMNRLQNWQLVKEN